MSPEYVQEWTRKAEADRLAAKRALEDSRQAKDQAEIACFHAQQCVEKFLKALLVLNGRHVPRIHDLLALARLLSKFNFPISKLEKSLRSLNQYAVEIRYPGYFAAVAEARKAVSAMEKIAKVSLRLLEEAP